MMGSDFAALLTSVNVLVQRFHYLRQDLDLICWPRGAVYPGEDCSESLSRYSSVAGLVLSCQGYPVRVRRACASRLEMPREGHLDLSSFA